MRLSDMRISDVRSAGGDRTCHRFGEVLLSGPRMRETFAHTGFDMRVGGACTARRGKREFPRDAGCVFKRGRGVGIVPASGGIVNPEYFECRLIHEDLDLLADHTGDGAHRIAHRGVRWNRQSCAEPACHFGIVGGGGRAVYRRGRARSAADAVP